MPISRIKIDGITDDSVTSAKIADNIELSGTEAARMPVGTTAQRASAQSGDIRFNSTLGLMEYYTGTAWKSIDIAPTITSVDDTEVDSGSGSTTTFTITGTGFASGATVKFIGSDASEISADSVTVDSATQLTVVATDSNFDNADEPYDIKVTNISGLSGTLTDQIYVDSAPTWTTSNASPIGNAYEGYAVSGLSVAATDAEGDAVTISETTSNLTTYGLTLNSDGSISGTASSVSGDTTVSFTARATANGKTADKSFDLVVKNDALNDNALPFTNYAWYPFTASNGNDYSVNNRHGTLSGGVTFASTDQPGPFWGNYAIFDGSNDYIQLPFSRGSSSNFTFATWFKTDTTGRYFLGDVGGAYNIAFTVHMSSSTGITVTVDASGGPTYNNTWSTSGVVSNMADDNWHHLIVTQIASSYRVYVDGNDLGTNSSTMVQRNGVNNFVLGSYSSGSGFWNGELDQVRFFSGDLDSTQAATLYNTESGMFA